MTVTVRVAPAGWGEDLPSLAAAWMDAGGPESVLKAELVAVPLESGDRLGGLGHLSPELLNELKLMGLDL